MKRINSIAALERWYYDGERSAATTVKEPRAFHINSNEGLNTIICDHELEQLLAKGRVTLTSRGKPLVRISITVTDVRKTTSKSSNRSTKKGS